MSLPLAFIRPCSPTTAKTVPAGDAWLHEPKLDGYWSERLRDLAEALRGIPARSVIIDAELCLPGAGLAPNFYGLPGAMRRGRQGELLVFAFDLLHRDGRDLRALPLVERRRRLERLLARADVPCLRLVEVFADGKRLLEVAERLHLEGIVSKRKASPYLSGPSREWRKIKTATWRAINRERWRLFEKPGRFVAR